MRVKLYLNDALCDIEGDETIAASYAIAPISDISKRTSFASITFNLPMTNNNRVIMESAEVVVNSSTLPYSILKARLKVDGIDQGIRSAELVSVKNTYQIKLYGGNIDFFNIIKDGRLSDLDFSAYDHEFDLPAILINNANTEGLIYALIDYHADSPNTAINNTDAEIEIKFLFPCMYLRTVFNTIFTDNGYTVDIGAFDDTFFNKIILPLTEPKIIVTESFSGNQDITLTYSETILNSFGIHVPGQNDEVNFSIDAFTCTITRTSTGDQSTVQISTAQEVTNDTLYQVNNNPSDRVHVISNLSFTLNDLGLTIVSNPDLTNNTPTDNKLEGFIDGEEYNFDIDVTFTNNAGFTFLFKVGMYPFFTQPVYPVIEGSVDGTEYLLNTQVDVSASMPDIKQSELLKDIAQKFNFIYQVDNQNKIVYLRQYQDIIDNKANALDWSDKVDYTERHEITFNSGYAQKNICKYSDDDTVIKPQGTDSEILINDLKLKPEQVLFESPFAASESVERLIGKQMNRIKIYSEEDVTKKENVVDRMLVLRRENFTLTYIVDGTPATPAADDYPLTYFIEPTQDNNLGFANNLLNNSTGFIDAIQSYKQVVIPIRLTPIDINQIDFFTPIWIELRGQPGAYYYISEIKQFKFTSTESTDVEFVKLT